MLCVDLLLPALDPHTRESIPSESLQLAEVHQVIN